ncbi:leucine-rich repeat domain-containing protein, partial [Flavobacterium psychrophilum]
MKKLLFFILIPFLGIAQDFTANGINYTITSSVAPFTVSVDKNPGFTGVAEIPETVAYNSENYTVTSIRDYAFAYCNRLTSVTIPNSVTSIGEATFFQCTGLTSITIPNALTAIGKDVLYKCSSLTSITIPNSVISIEESAFDSCSGLTSVNIPNSVTDIRKHAFRKCTGLTTINCHITEPLIINSNVFKQVNQSNCALNVPAGTEAAYQAAAVWKDFSPISGSLLSNHSFA